MRRRSNSEQRSQIGIEALLLFMALVLVAAIAVSIMVNTSGMLHERSSETGEQATKQISTGVKVLAVTGYTDSSYVSNASLIVTMRAGTKSVDLGNTTISYQDGETSQVLTYTSGTPDADSFNVTAVLDNPAPGSHPVLNHKEDVFKININIAAIRGDQGLPEGEVALVEINPALGQKTVAALTAPSSVEGKDVVDLR